MLPDKQHVGLTESPTFSTIVAFRAAVAPPLTCRCSMKKRTKKAASSLKTTMNVLLTVIVALITILLPLALAALLIALLLVYSVLAWRLPEPENAADFTFTATELQTFEALEPREKQMQKALSALWRQGSHLSKRKDGYFSERSKLGEQLNPEIQQLERELGEDRNFIVEYGAFAEQRKRHYLRIKSRRLATLFAALVYGSIAALLLYIPNGFITTFALMINPIGLLPPPAALPNLWAAMAVATVVTIALFVPIKAVADFLTRVKLSLGASMNASDAIEFSGRYAAHSVIGEA